MKNWLLILIVLAACEVKPVEINYGMDQCHYCSMTIVDQSHSAQYVTDKGKPFKFDAIECMFRDLRNLEIEPVMMLVSTVDEPGKLTEVSDAYFVISEKIPSPMGANLTAFTDSTEAAVYTGQIPVFKWQTMSNYLK